MQNNNISQDAIKHIFWHIKNAWKYNPPTGPLLETVIYRGVLPFYPNAKKLGSSLTWVDLSIGDDAYDEKGFNGLNIYSSSKPPKLTEGNDKKYFVKSVVLPNNKTVFVKIPSSFELPVRRPTINFTNFNKDPLSQLTSVVNEYSTYVKRTSHEAGCSNLYSFTCLYGEKNNIKAAFLTITDFELPVICKANVILRKKDGAAVGYEGFDEKNNRQCKIKRFSKGSINFYKTYSTEHGILFVWEDDQNTTAVADQMVNEKDGTLLEV